MSAGQINVGLNPVQSEIVPRVNNATDAAAVIEAMERLGGAQLVTLGNDNAAVIMPIGMRVSSLRPLIDDYLKRPRFARGTAALSTLPSFIAHVTRFKTPDSAVFASASELVAVYDYHLSEDTPGFCQHRAAYDFPWSAEWKAWTGIDGAKLPQKDFAQFIEDHVMDVTAANTDDATTHFAELGFALASGSQMLALSRGLLVRVESEAVGRHNLSSGEVEISYKETHADAMGQPLKIPGGFMLLIPPFEDGARYRIPVRLRYAVSSGKVFWTVLMHRRAAVVADAIKDACAEVVDKTGVALFHGTPEKP